MAILFGICAYRASYCRLGLCVSLLRFFLGVCVCVCVCVCLLDMARRGFDLKTFPQSAVNKVRHSPFFFPRLAPVHSFGTPERKQLSQTLELLGECVCVDRHGSVRFFLFLLPAF